MMLLMLIVLLTMRIMRRMRLMRKRMAKKKKKKRNKTEEEAWCKCWWWWWGMKMMMMMIMMMMMMTMMMMVRRRVRKRCMRTRSEAMPEDAFRSEALTSHNYTASLSGTSKVCQEKSHGKTMVEFGACLFVSCYSFVNVAYGCIRAISGIYWNWLSYDWASEIDSWWGVNKWEQIAQII